MFAPWSVRQRGLELIVHLSALRQLLPRGVPLDERHANLTLGLVATPARPPQIFMQLEKLGGERRKLLLGGIEPVKDAVQRILRGVRCGRGGALRAARLSLRLAAHRAQSISGQTFQIFHNLSRETPLRPAELDLEEIDG